MKKIIIPFLVLSCTGCVTASMVKPEDTSVVEGYTCESLETKLIAAGALKDRAESNQNMNTGKEIVGHVVANVLTFGLAGSTVQVANSMNASGNEKKYKAVLETYYKEWDKKKCSEWLYLKNKENNK